MKTLGALQQTKNVIPSRIVPMVGKGVSYHRPRRITRVDL